MGLHRDQWGCLLEEKNKLACFLLQEASPCSFETSKATLYSYTFLLCVFAPLRENLLLRLQFTNHLIEVDFSIGKTL